MTDKQTFVFQIIYPTENGFLVTKSRVKSDTLLSALNAQFKEFKHTNFIKIEIIKDT